MRKLLTWFGYLILLLFLVFAIYKAVFLVFPIFSGCEAEIKEEVKSPDGKYIVAEFEWLCGATTAPATIINLRPSGLKFDAKEFVRLLIVDGQPEVSIEWKDNTHLVITYPKNNKTFIQVSSWHEIKVAFQEK
jgi:hypothetical protein